MTSRALFQYRISMMPTTAVALTVEIDGAPAHVGAEVHVGDVADQDRGAVHVRSHGDLFDILDLLRYSRSPRPCTPSRHIPRPGRRRRCCFAGSA